MALAIAHSQEVERISAPFYRPELDCLRFVAFLLVFLAHTAFNAPQHGLPDLVVVAGSVISGFGIYGVDLFYILSAYLITTLLLKERGIRGTLDVNHFYVRRILRIWPLYFFFIGVVFVLARFDSSQVFGWKQLLAYAFLSGNWIQVFGGPQPSVAVSLWSVSVEEQFYLTWPRVVKAISLASIRRLCYGLIVVAWLSRGIATATIRPHPYIWENTLCHLDSIAIGVLLAIFLFNRKLNFSPIKRIGLAGSAFAVLAIIGRWLDIQHLTRSQYAVTLTAFPLAIGSCVALFLSFHESSFHPRPLVYLGKISYGLYVYHLLAILIAKRIMHGHTHSASGAALTLALSFLGTITVAAISYELLEKPFLRIKERFTRVESRPI